MIAPPILWHITPRARHISLRVDASKRAVVLTLPPRVSRRHGMEFLQHHIQWISKALASLPPTALESGFVLLEGQKTILHHHHEIPLNTKTPAAAWQNHEGVHLSGPEPEQQLRLFLQQQAMKILPQALKQQSQRMGLWPNQLSLRNVKSRWGSCTRQGHIMLNWRLIMAPPFIHNYVILHELAHLQHFNHGQDFWKLVDSSYPEGQTGRKKAEKWLREHGTHLLCTI